MTKSSLYIRLKVYFVFSAISFSFAELKGSIWFQEEAESYLHGKVDILQESKIGMLLSR
jgi:hypothetical protein